MQDGAKSGAIGSPVSDRSAWRRHDVEQERDWIVWLTESDLLELNAAIAANVSLATDAITRDSFAMPHLSRKLLEIAKEVDGGRGFALLRGFPVDQYSEAERRTAVVGISTHFGKLISQNKFGDTVCSVRSTGRRMGEPGVRGYDTDAELRYHNDECDIIVLLCLQPARSGGLSSLVSSTSMYNAILRECPQHLDTLHRGVIFSLMQEQRPGVGPVSDHRIPIFSWCEGKLSCRFTLNTIYQAARETGVALTTAEQEALNAVLETARRAEFQIAFQLEKGDIQFANNMTTLHSRTAFEDHDDPDLRRHLLRLWLVSHHPRPLAPEFEERYNDGWSFRQGIPVSATRDTPA